MIRRLLKLVIPGLCVLSLLACAGSGWLWYRSFGGRDRFTFRMLSERYLLISRGGYIGLVGPPRGAEGDQSGKTLVERLRNDQYRFGVGYDRVPDGLMFVFIPRPAPDSPAHQLMARGPHTKSIRPSVVDPDLVRPLLRALDDPKRFAAAHLLLWQQSGLSTWRVDKWFPYGAQDMHPRRNADDLVFDIEGLTFTVGAHAPSSTGWRVEEDRTSFYAGNRVGQAIPLADGEPAEAPAIREYWHVRLDVVYGYVRWPFFIAATAVVPLMCLALSVRRSMIRRRRQRRGLCVHCGYDLRGSSGRCSECGEAIPSAAGVLT